MRIKETDRYYWNIHFFDTLYSNRLYQDFDSVKDLCEYMGVKRNTFELYKTYKY